MRLSLLLSGLPALDRRAADVHTANLVRAPENSNGDR